MELEDVRKEMMARGCTKMQIDSKLVPIVVDIVTGMNYTYEDLEISKEQLNAIRESIKYWRANLYAIKNEYAQINADKKKAMNELTENAIEYIEQFNKALENTETAEARDRLKTAQIFVNSVNVDTKYDNTAFIVALASILTGGSYEPITELRKINTDLVKPMTMPYVRG